jgi:drug/metabolite transporter (DMT)-like permease
MAWHQSTFSAAVCALPMLFVLPSPFAVALPALADRDVLLGVAFTALPATVGSIALMSHFQRFLSPSHAAVIYTLEPVFTAVFSRIFYGEEFGAAKLAGGALVVAGNLACVLTLGGGAEKPPGGASRPAAGA